MSKVERPIPPETITWITGDPSWPMERQRRLVALVASGMTMVEVDDAMNCSSGLRLKVLHQLGYKMPERYKRMPWSDAAEAVLRSMWADGRKTPQICDALAEHMPRRPSSTMVRDRAIKIGLQPYKHAKSPPAPSDVADDEYEADPVEFGITLPTVAFLSASTIALTGADYAAGAYLARATA